MVANQALNSLKVLLVMHECNPDWTSVPLVAFQYYRTLRQLSDVTLVTHCRNRRALSQAFPEDDIRYIDESALTRRYFKYVVDPLTVLAGNRVWQLFTAMAYPVYAEFNQGTYAALKDEVAAGEFDIVHAITPMMPRYPYKLSQVCQRHGIPFVLGPINGGLPYPKGFQDVASKDFAYFSALRSLGRNLIPDYRETYQRADLILAGSTHTLNLVQDLLNIEDERIRLFFENGINRSFVETMRRLKSVDEPVNLLFVGRLVALKGADMLLSAIAALPDSLKHNVRLRIVGDGVERSHLEAQTQQLGLQERVEFTGWVEQADILNYYAQADVFCFPSIKDFGGAVVMEAMATGLPCVAVNYGGVSEYITPETGFKIDPISRDYVTTNLTRHIGELVQNPQLRYDMSIRARQHAQSFMWENKAQVLMELYESLRMPQATARVAA
ncbi:MAG: glycosyltransferase family 4 protein [Cyanobacteria bacterium J06648_16]